jgi:A/G-specific adenine glycosylase
MSREQTHPNWSRGKIRALQERLLHWYRHHKRVLPWRSNPTPYRVWIAEIMLQQTRVQTVLPYYDRFLERFPDVEALASASEQDVLQLWAGLGYYRRARHLHEAARMMVAESATRFPQTLAKIKRLPGVGRYTAGAIHSIAFNQPQPVVDGNVMRVISRLHGIADAPDAFFWREAESWLARDEPADFNQAVMELGALVCIPRNPLCGKCPLLSLCKSGRAHRLPRARKRAARAQETVELVMLVLECEGKVLLARQPKGGFIPGEWGLPVRILPNKGVPLTGAASLARKILGSVPEFRSFPPVHHGITHRTILAHVCRTTFAPPPPHLTPANHFSWQPRPGIERLLTSSLFHKGLAASMPTDGQ